jgi:leucyl aminopeptidase
MSPSSISATPISASPFVTAASSTLIDLHTTTAAGLVALQAQLPAAQAAWISSSGFATRPSGHMLLPGVDGAVGAVVAIVDPADPVWALAALAESLPAGQYRLASGGEIADVRSAALGWALAHYRFDRYKSAPRPTAQLLLDADVHAEVESLAAAITQVRDLVNMPPNDMGPAELAETVRALAGQHDAEVREWVGEELLAAGFTMIHTVGRAASRAPRLIELRWGEADAPRLTLIGKGVCFDTGGVDIKGPEGMRWMKKDMGGAAHAIALARLIMQAKLPVRLCLLVPAVENSVSGDSMRPGDIVRTSAGLSVEIHNTDAEGRLILGDALTHAAADEPELVIDLATLTGAARVALGPELPALFSNDEATAAGLLQHAGETADPLWRMPLWRPYRRMLDSSFADMTNAATGAHAGAITAALYLERFAPAGAAWVHIDVFAWNDAARPGRPRGGEAQGLRALFSYLQARFGMGTAGA